MFRDGPHARRSVVDTVPHDLLSGPQSKPEEVLLAYRRHPSKVRTPNPRTNPGARVPRSPTRTHTRTGSNFFIGSLPGPPPTRNGSPGRTSKVRGSAQRVGKEHPRRPIHARPSREGQPRRLGTTAHGIALDAVDADTPSRPSPGQGQHGKTIA